MSRTAVGGNAAEHGYRRSLRELQIELVKFQRDLIKRSHRILVLIEGRDAAGKDGVIKHIIEHLSPRDTRAVALPAPTTQQQTEWYFQRYVAHLPAAGEFVLFNRSWYNRAGVERVMGFSTEAEVETFLEDAPIFERMLVNSGIRLFKYHLDIDRHEQIDRSCDAQSGCEVGGVDTAAGRWDKDGLDHLGFPGRMRSSLRELDQMRYGLEAP
jgi:polyphosphate kinase 2 (PPK2 family)